jgi:hypothetical protein
MHAESQIAVRVSLHLSRDLFASYEWGEVSFCGVSALCIRLSVFFPQPVVILYLRVDHH